MALPPAVNAGFTAPSASAGSSATLVATPSGVVLTSALPLTPNLTALSQTLADTNMNSPTPTSNAPPRVSGKPPVVPHDASKASGVPPSPPLSPANTSPPSGSKSSVKRKRDPDSQAQSTSPPTPGSSSQSSQSGPQSSKAGKSRMSWSSSSASSPSSQPSSNNEDTPSLLFNRCPLRILIAEGTAVCTGCTRAVAYPRHALLLTAVPSSVALCLRCVDNAINQKVLCKMLNRLGYSDDLVDVASNGRLAFDAVLRAAEAMATQSHDDEPLRAAVEEGGEDESLKRHLRRDAYHLVFMDIYMPAMDGLDATVAIRGEPRISADLQPYVVALTANAMTGDKQKCLEAGMELFLSKPVTLGPLVQALKTAHAATVKKQRIIRQKAEAERRHEGGEDVDDHPQPYRESVLSPSYRPTKLSQRRSNSGSATAPFPLGPPSSTTTPLRVAPVEAAGGGGGGGGGRRRRRRRRRRSGWSADAVVPSSHVIRAHRRTVSGRWEWRRARQRGLGGQGLSQHADAGQSAVADQRGAAAVPAESVADDRLPSASSRWCSRCYCCWRLCADHVGAAVIVGVSAAAEVRE